MTKDTAPEPFVVGEIVEWVESDGVIWDVEVLDITSRGVVVEYGWKTALFAPSSKNKNRYALLDGTAEKADYIRRPKKTKNNLK